MSPANRRGTSNARSPAAKAVSAVRLSFDDNSLLPLLYGEHDQHLARLEQKLGVHVAARGDRLEISGPAEASRTAEARSQCRSQQATRTSPANVASARVGQSRGEPFLSTLTLDSVPLRGPSGIRLLSAPSTSLRNIEGIALSTIPHRAAGG